MQGTASAVTGRAAWIEEFFRRVDAHDFEWVEAALAPACVIDAPGFKQEGADEALAQFRDVALIHYEDESKRAGVETAIQFFGDEFRHLSPAAGAVAFRPAKPAAALRSLHQPA